MNSEVKKRKKRFWAFCLAFVLLLESAMPMSVLAAEYNFDNLTMNPEEINKVNIVYPGDRIVIPSSLSLYQLDYSNKLGQHKIKSSTESSFVVDTYEAVFGVSNEGTCWKIEGKGYSCGTAYLMLVECTDSQSYTKSNIYYELYGGVNATSNPSTYYEGMEEITLADASKAGYTFDGWYSDDAFTTKVESISTTETGDITLYAKFTPNLISITNPQNITGVANGTEKNATALELPANVTIATGDTSITTADVSWDLTNLESGTYDPSVLTEQSFTVKGTVTLPEGVDNPNNVDLHVTIQVTVSAADIVGSVQATPAAGTYDSNQSVELGSSTEGATIYYTTDGSEPALSGGTPSGTTTKYTAPIAVTGKEGQSVQTTIKAIAVKDRMQSSGIATFSYTIEIPDTTAPTAEINVGINRWNEFWNTVTFGYFFKNTKQVTITASDNVTTSPDIKYYLSDDELTEREINDSGIAWENYTAPFDIIANSKKIIYAKATDGAGNTTVVNSAGFVIYKDSTPDTTDITYTYKENADKAVTVDLNGNTVATIKDKDGNTLTEDRDYSVNATTGAITIKASYLDTLSASETPYTLTVSYNPLGEFYKANPDAGENDLNDAPSQTVISVKVNPKTITATVKAEDKVYDGSVTAQVTATVDTGITGETLTISGLTGSFKDSNAGSDKTVTVDSSSVNVTGVEEGTSASNYSITYVQTTNASITPRIATLTWGNSEFTYNGNEQAPVATVSNLVSGDECTVTVTGGQTDANEKTGQASYTVHATGLSNSNYKLPDSGTDKTFTIAQKEVTVQWTNTQFTYDGSAHKPAASLVGVLDGDTCNITVSGERTNANAAGETYTARASIDNSNYIIKAGDETTKFTIKNASQTAPTLTGVNETIKGKADGKITGLTTDMEYRIATQSEGVGNENTNPFTKVTDADMTFAAGTYEVRYGAKPNYDASPAATVTISEGRMLQVTIPQAAAQIGYSLTIDADELAWNDDTTLTFTLAPGYSELESFEVKAVYTGSENNADDVNITDNGDGTYTISNVTGDVKITVESVGDNTAPTGEIAVADSRWNSFLNEITFGMFFKTAQSVTITASDSGSGLKDIHYYLADREMSLEEIKALTSEDWTEYTDTFSMNEERRYVVYAKLTDNDNNTACISSDGIVIYQDSAPVEADITYAYKENADRTVTVALNGNTVVAIRDKDGKTLTVGSDYSVDAATGAITIKASYLNTLSASDTPYTLTVSYNPQGETYEANPDAEGNDLNDVPAQTTISVKVNRAQLTVTETPTTENTAETVSADDINKNSVKLNTEISLVWKNDKLTVSWETVSGADGYDIFATECGTKMDAKSLVKTVKGGKSSASLTKIAGTKLSGKEEYKVRIKAYKLVGGKKNYIGNSDLYHIAGKNNKKYTNAKKITVSKKSVSLKVGKTSQIKAQIVKQSKTKKLLPEEHGPALRYYSTDKSIATVTAKGKIKAKQKGSCYIYIKALNGVTTKVKVTVK